MVHTKKHHQQPLISSSHHARRARGASKATHGFHTSVWRKVTHQKKKKKKQRLGSISNSSLKGNKIVYS